MTKHDEWDDASRPAGAPGWIAWVIVVGLLVGLFFLGGWLVVRPPSEPSATEPKTTTSEPSATKQTNEPAETDSPTTEEPETPTASPTLTGEPMSLTGTATAEVPGSAPANDDVDGTQVTFVGPNLLDGDPETAWRLGGDQAGSVLTFRFATPVTITSVGLINGWAKTTTSTSGTEYDWYTSNRRVLSVEWVIDGQTFPQQLTDTRDLQTLDVTPTETSDVQLRITSVSTPGTPNPRDYTAISEIALNGLGE